MDKTTVLLAEQVGLFLAPTLRAMVASVFNSAQGAMLDKFLEMSKGIDGVRADLETLRATLGAEALVLAASLKELSAQSGAALEAQSGMQGLLEGALSSVRSLGEADAALVKRVDALAITLVEHRDVFGQMEQSLDSTREEALRTIDGIRVGLTGKVSSVLADQQAVKAQLEVLGKAGDAMRNNVAAVESSVERLRDETLIEIGGLEAKVVSSGAALREQVDGVRETFNILAKRPPPVMPEIVPPPTIEEVVAACEPVLTARVDAAVRALEIPAPPPAVHIPTWLGSVDPAMVADAVAAAVKAIELPTIDNDAVNETLSLMVMQELDAVVPELQRKLAANVQDQVQRAVAALPVPKDGADGAAGADGACGLMPLVEPYLEGFVYERGAAVLYGGGTWQATRRTKTAPAPDLPDWQGLAVGVSGLALQAGADGRSVGLTASLSDGSTVKASVALPTMVYRGVFDEEKDYEPADVVTHAGSMWIAEKAVAGASPSKSPESWRLIVKRGQDGKGGRDGADGVQFQAGYAGEYEEDKVYPKNSIVTYASSLWLSKRATKDRPPYMSNQDNEHWLRVR